jgi:hypothetical protein
MVRYIQQVLDSQLHKYHFRQTEPAFGTAMKKKQQQAYTWNLFNPNNKQGYNDTIIHCTNGKNGKSDKMNWVDTFSGTNTRKVHTVNNQSKWRSRMPENVDDR